MPEISGTETTEWKEWSVPLPEKVPEATYWPAVMALGINFFLFGIVVSWAFSAVGLVLFGLSLSRWVKELLDHGD